jgi:hypothetical protein
MSGHNISPLIQTEHGNFHPKEIIEIHCGARQYTNQAIAAKVMAMEWFFQNLECRTPLEIRELNQRIEEGKLVKTIPVDNHK